MLALAPSAALGALERGPGVEGADAVGAPAHQRLAADLLVALLVRVRLLVLRIGCDYFYTSYSL